MNKSYTKFSINDMNSRIDALRMQYGHLEKTGVLVYINLYALYRDSCTTAFFYFLLLLNSTAI